jgi:ABC-type branched-subunit amino acid transport system substrate-binding protein
MRIKMVKSKRVSITILAVALTALLLFTACAPGPSMEEKKVVTIGMIAPFTGAPSTAIQRAYRLMMSYFSYFEEVGVPGITFPTDVAIKIAWADSQFQPVNAISIYERMQERGNVVLYYTPSPVEGTALKSRFERDEMPDVIMSVDETMMYPPGWIFSIYPTESERFAVVSDWIMDNWQEERPPRVVIMGTDSASGRAPEVMGTAYAESVGIEMLPFIVVPYLPLDVSPQFLKARDEGVDFIYCQAIETTTLALMREAEKLGLTDKIRFGGMETSQSIRLVESGPGADGYFATRTTPWYEDIPAVRDIYGEDPGHGEAGSDLTVYSVMIEAIGKAIEEVGYENLDGRAVREGFYSIKDFDPFGIGTPVTYTRQDNRGEPKLAIWEVRGGTVVRVTDWRKAPMLVP